MRRTTSTLLALATLTACGREVGVVALPAVYGDDDRVEVLAHPDETIRRVGVESVFAMVSTSWPRDWRLCDPDALAIVAPTHAESASLCPEVRFADQQAIADCSAVLIDDDLVLTASHCVEDEEQCRETRFVGGLYLEETGALRTITRDDVYHCQRIAASPSGRDAVVLQLDRPVSPRYRPAPLSTRVLERGDALAVIGFPGGLPMKVADHCEVKGFGPSGATFRPNCEVFGGSSGGPVFDERGEVVGIMTLGGGGYRPDPERGCRVLVLYDEDGRLLTAPAAVPQLGEAEMMASVVAALCDSEWPTSICGRAASCGDARCTGTETRATCPSDCTEPSCGDARCSPGEDYTCATDCGERDIAECGGEPDAGVPLDASIELDASIDPDAGTEPDGSIDPDAGTEPDAGIEPAPAPSGGGCSVSAHRSSAAWWWMLALGVLVLSRARARV